MTKTEKILKLLEDKKPVTNRRLNQIAFRYGARIHDLRQRGYRIQTIRISDGLFAFQLISKPKNLV